MVVEDTCSLNESQPTQQVRRRLERDEDEHSTNWMQTGTYYLPLGGRHEIMMQCLAAQQQQINETAVAMIRMMNAIADTVTDKYLSRGPEV